MQETKNILLITAHADDHILSAGTVFKLKGQGYDVYEAILTTSNEGRDFRDPTGSYNVELMRDTEFQKASEFLGTKRVWRFGEDDLGLEYSKELVFKLVQIIREVQPHVGIVMNKHDWHPDHVVANHIGTTAFKMAATGIKPELGVHHRTPVVLAVEGMVPIQPTMLVDISDTYQKKMDLLKIYESQASEDTVSFVEGLARVRGFHLRKSGSVYAEAFTTDMTAPMLLFE